MPRAPEPDPPGIPELAAGLLGGASPRAGLTYRLLRLTWRAVAGALGFRVTVTGLEHLPRDAAGHRTGGWILAGIPHRSWVDPFLPWGWLPAEPRLCFFGDARTMARSPLRRWVMRRLGGVIPIPSRGGARTFETHLDAAATVLASGAVFHLYPESGFMVPPGQARPVAAGLGYIALRTGAPIVPVVIGGNDRLFLGRRLSVMLMAPRTWQAWASADGRGDVPADAPAPAPGSAEERRMAHRIADGVRAGTADAVREGYEAAVPGEGTRQRWTGLTTLFR